MPVAQRTYYSFIFIAVISGTFLLACHPDKPFFHQLTPPQSGIRFINTVVDSDSFDVFHYPYLFAGAGVAIGDIDNDGLDDIFLVANRKGGNRLFRNKGGFQFEDITPKAGITQTADWNTGVTMADINGDGLLDIYVSTVSIPGVFTSANQLFINQGDGRFAEGAAKYGLDKKYHTTQADFFDYDRDGDLDCFLLNHAVTYTDDYQSIAIRGKVDSASGSKLLRNDEGYFTDVTAQAGIYSASNQYGLGLAIGDLNNDGWPDIYVSNDFKENDFCYINKGDGSFTEQGNDLFPHMSRFSMGNDMADYNNDGWLDVLTLDMLSPDEKVIKTSLGDDDIETYNYKHQNFGFHYQFSRNCLQQNVDGRGFTDIALQQGVAATDWSWAPLLADFDNDGRKDLYVSNGFKYRTNDLDFNVFAQDVAFKNTQQNRATNRHNLAQYLPSGAVPDYFFLNKGEGGFAEASSKAGFTQPTTSNGAAYADLDNDGDLDLVVNRMNEPVGIYRNDLPAANFLSIDLKGKSPNTYGVSATVYAYTKGKMQCYTQSPTRGFMSSVSPVLHIGLGNDKTVDSLIILWPDGSGQQLKNIKANQRLSLQQKEASPHFSRPVLAHAIASQWVDVTDSSGLLFTHKEDDFDDLNGQPFLPHSLCTQGPKLAVADVNGDGLEDFFTGGAKGQSGDVFLQTVGGKFIKSTQTALAADSLFEDTNALFFDADGDGDKDLYVTSGGNELYGHETLLADRLYLNNGKGNFTKSDGLPNLYENKSCVRACDFDKDGDLDLFVGGRANARMFGYTPASVILTNNGKGKFTEVTQQVGDGLQNAGMVTDACWTDIDGDGWMDLIVAGEWMPVTIFKNERGKLVKTDPAGLQTSSGWWQCIYPADVDGDGDIDFLLGNWGTNTKLTATADHPLKMYIADWDKNGETEPVLSIFKNDGYYTFLGKTDLEKRLPFLKKRFLKYGDIAGKTVEEVFTADALKEAKLLQAYTLQSSVLMNNKGNWKLEALPSFLQTAPLFSFAQLPSGNKNKTFIAAGNFYEVSPYEGRYDAMLPVLFSFTNGKANMQSCLLQKGPVRSVATINLRAAKGLLIARNNGPLSLLKYKTP